MNQKERIQQLKEEIDHLSGGRAVMGGIDQLPPDVAEEFLRRVLDVEKQDIEDRNRDAN